MNNPHFQAELKQKIKAGIKPSHLKKNPTMPYDQAKYLLELEEQKADLLTQLTHYQQEQTIAVTTFKKQERLISQKEQQLTEKDDLIIAKEEQIAKLKKRIHQLAKEKKEQVIEIINPVEKT